MHKLTVSAPNGKYDIITGTGLLQGAGEYISSFSSKRIGVITDENVGKLYAPVLSESLRECGIIPVLMTVPAGEQSKSASMLARLWERLAEEGFTRSEAVVALGGGVVGDLAGFAAATYLRGVPLIQMPTTLLAMADSSVGGKVAVNLTAGKNLAGSFYQPKLVLQDISCLESLDRRQLHSGMAEVIKTAAIGDCALFERLEKATDLYSRELLPDIIGSCCAVKASVVESDPFDTGRRMILNFGHTLGHAIEKETSFGLLHGEAVALGMPYACRWGEAIGITSPQVTKRVVALIEKAGLSTTLPPLSKSQLLSTIRIDKKSSPSDIGIVILKEIGNAVTVKISIKEFEKIAFII